MNDRADMFDFNDYAAQDIPIGEPPPEPERDNFISTPRMTTGLPANLESEKALLSACINLTDGPACARQIAEELSPEDFYSEKHQRIMLAVHHLLIDGTEPTLPALLAWFTETGGVGLGSYLSSLFDDFPAAIDLNYHIRNVRSAAIRRRAKSEVSRLLHEVDELPPEEIETRLRNTHQAVCTEIEIGNDRTIYAPTWDNCPPEAEPIVKLNDTPVLHRGNIAMLTAGAGQGKTAAMHGALPTMVHADNETLGLSAFGSGATVLDTEHDERLFNLLWQRFMFRCGFSRGTPAPENIRFKNIRAVESLSARLSILWSEFRNCPGLLMIDGIGDFVADPNNSDECTALVYRLSSEAQKHDVGVLLTLHNNPLVGNEKARGVLGSEIWRKAQSTLIIKRNSDGIAQITTEYSLGKNRQNSDRLSAYFYWDDDLKMHVACDPPEENGSAGKSAKQQQEIIAALTGEYTHTDLVDLVMGIAGVKKRQAVNKIKKLIEMGLIEKTPENLYHERKTSHWSDDL